MRDAGITEQHKDILAELANIGTGNAATALSQMLDHEKILLEVPEVNISPLQHVPESLGDPGQKIAAIMMEAACDELELTILLALPLPATLSLIDQLLPEGLEPLGEMGRSLLMELGNILTGSYLNALSDMTGLTFTLSPPGLGLDMAGALLGSVIADKAMLEDSFILIKTTMHILSREVEGNLLLLPSAGSLHKILARLGAQ
ncbi:MAG: CheY-P-specific phosphatase CheC [Firmicutes bacterium]|nr:CheY-P-specific phosphatase CheC [Bacillota bacterium]